MVPVAALEGAVDEESQQVQCVSPSGLLYVLSASLSASWRLLGRGVLPPSGLRNKLERLHRAVHQVAVPEHHQAHGRDGQLAPTRFLVQDCVEVCRVRGIEDRPVPFVEAQLERLVALEHEDGLRIEPRGQERGHLPAAELETVLEALDVYRAVSRGPTRQPAQQLAVDFGEAPQLEPAEQVVGVVDGAVVGTQDVAGPDRVVVLVDLLVAAGAPAGVAEQQRGAVVDPGQGLVECLVGHEPSGPARPLEEPMLAITLEPGHACGVGPPPLAHHEEPGEQPSEMIALLGPAPLLTQDDAGLPAHHLPPSGSTTNPRNSPSEYCP